MGSSIRRNTLLVKESGGDGTTGRQAPPHAGGRVLEDDSSCSGAGEQIAGWLRTTHPDRPDWQVRHETIYQGVFSIFRFHGDELAAVESINDPMTHLTVRKILGAGGTLTPDQADETVDLRALARNLAG
ncbi:oxidoreductase C-terminal domain-containing protein [Rhodococcus koreensis]|uniref:oxidoreductase C-terminal domain-containing protein n=1 Tax=Rhodococcus koreensis TaxID=99653 RepID=UPI0036DC8951